jgi:type IX secretion system PorP/SprF family membrane protein
MKRILLVGLLVLVGLESFGQFMPNSSQAFQFASLYNPAFTGMEAFQDLKLGYRYQWSGFGSDAPKFINLSFNVRVKEPLDLTLNAIRTSMAKNQNKEIPRMKGAIHGLGGNVFSEQFGLIKRAGGGLNYSFHYPLTKKMRLAMGASAMVENTKIDVNKIYFGLDPRTRQPIDPGSDPIVQNLQGGAGKTSLNFRAGFLLYTQKFYFGFSYLPIASVDIQSNETDLDEPSYRGTFQGGYSFPLNATMDLKPSILALWQVDNTFLIDYNVKVYIEQKIWFGLTYRDIKSMIGIVGFNLNERLGASYSYELSANKLRQFSDGSHDLVLSVRLNNFKRQRQQTW